jgi:peptidoglycan/LPS O-acetylase OafA/YrhL
MTDNTRERLIPYRPDVDGLRAVAIVPVVLYHADIVPFTGGYVGVDVFFVISGYLITTFILGKIDAKNFSLRNFYLRRIRRIFPALFLMMAVCAAIGWQLLTPRDLKRLGESIFTTTLFSSNVQFWLQSGYFRGAVEQRPLLHTWSLGVEEQFYLVFPIFLLLLCRYFRRWLIGIVASLCVLSFVLNALTVKEYSNFAFFLTPPRIWELFIGALLAMGALRPPRNAPGREAVAFVGVALIGYAVFRFSKETTFPGFAALLPTFGAAAIIWAGTGGNSTVTRALSHPLAVLTGKISYSFYLWHFPLLAFGSYVVVNGLSVSTRLVLILLSAVLAIASWLWVEQPVRQGNWIFGKTAVVFGAAATAIALFGAFGFMSYVVGGFPNRFSKPILQIVSSENDFNPDRARCLKLAGTHEISRPSCLMGARDVEPQFVLWGDSHAESLRPAVDAAATKVHRAGMFFGTAGCIPELGFERERPGCHSANSAILEEIKSMPSIDTVILAGRWGLWAEGSPYKHEAGGQVLLTSVSRNVTDNHAALSAGLESVVAELLGAKKQVWLVGPIPEIGYDVPRTLFLSSRGFPWIIDIRPTVEEFNGRQAFVLTLFSNIARKYKVQIVWPHHRLCGANYCRVQQDGRPIYVDDQHLTRSAAASLAEIFDPLFAASVPRAPADVRVR